LPEFLLSSAVASTLNNPAAIFSSILGQMGFSKLVFPGAFQPSFLEGVNFAYRYSFLIARVAAT
jgi:hypothetical protein